MFQVTEGEPLAFALRWNLGIHPPSVIARGLPVIGKD